MRPSGPVVAKLGASFVVAVPHMTAPRRVSNIYGILNVTITAHQAASSEDPELHRSRTILQLPAPSAAQLANQSTGLPPPDRGGYCTLITSTLLPFDDVQTALPPPRNRDDKRRPARCPRRQ
jgi:hypothetical protein